jgi:hypothetical protein
MLRNEAPDHSIKEMFVLVVTLSQCRIELQKAQVSDTTGGDSSNLVAI